MVAGTEKQTTQQSLVDPYSVSKTVGIIIITFVSLLLLTDFIVLKRRGVFRPSSEHFAHLSFLALAGASIALTNIGEIL